MLRLDDHWVWDSWVVDDSERFHLFYLQAPRALRDAGLRHTHATVGHASSEDLVSWTVHPDALGPGPAGSWDDLAIWTGSVVRDDGMWRMFYTAISAGPHGMRRQRIGAAESDDLMTWRRMGTEPVLVADTRWYKSVDEDLAAREAWRDPLVFRDPHGVGWHALVTARAASAARNDDGVLAHACSDDLRVWDIGPPVCRPGAGFGHLEVPQVKVIEGTPVLVFTCHPDEQTADRRARSGDYCTWSVPGASVLGPWDIDLAGPFVADPALFAAPLVQRRDGSWVFVGFRNLAPEGVLAFEIIDPIPVVLEDGYVVAHPSYSAASVP